MNYARAVNLPTVAKIRSGPQWRAAEHSRNRADPLTRSRQRLERIASRPAKARPTSARSARPQLRFLRVVAGGGLFSASRFTLRAGRVPRPFSVASRPRRTSIGSNPPRSSSCVTAGHQSLPSCPISKLVEGGGFEPPKAEPTDLQSVPFDRLGIPPQSRALLRIEPALSTV